MRSYNFWVYITTNPTQTVLYVGMTNNIVRRLVQHYQNRGKPETFAGKYYCYNLIWCEWHQYIYNTIAREKEIKTFTHQQKQALVLKDNPTKRFMNAELCGDWPPTQELIDMVIALPDDDKYGC
jgi:putative endonuclease